MPAPLRIKLNPEEENTLTELRQSQSIPYRIRDREAYTHSSASPSGNRAHMLKLNAQGITVPEIARIFDCHEHTVRATIKRWEKLGLAGLKDAPGRGAKPKQKSKITNQKSNKGDIVLKNSTKLNEEMRCVSVRD
jgi:transposase-like protein